jgi:voltage-gated potassium channel
MKQRTSATDGRGSATSRAISTSRSWLQALLFLAVVTAAFGLLPWRRFSLQSGLIVVITFGVGMLGAATLVLSQAVRYRRAVSSGSARVRGLLMAVYVSVLFFATGFYLLQRADPDQFTGLTTRLDAFYFTLSVLSTVGFGDVHADGQAARAMVCAQIAFNLLVISLAFAAARAAGPPALSRTERARDVLRA